MWSSIPQATSLGGWTGSVNLNRNAGVHGVNAALWAVSPGFDSSDAGFNFAGDRAGMHAVYQWRNPKVTRFARNRFLAIAKWYTWNFARELQGDGVHMFGNVELKNYWTVFANVGLFRTVAGRSRDARRAVDAAARVAQRVHRHRERRTQSASRSAATVSTDHNEVGGWSRGLGINVRYRPAAALEISAGPSFERTHSLSQYVDAFEDPVAADTYGSRYVFSTLDQEEFSLQTRVNYVLSPKMSLQVYMQPLVSVGALHGVQAVRPPAHLRLHPARRPNRGSLTYDPSTRKYTATPADGGATFEFDDPDFNFKSLRLNAIFRWEWRPGSALYLVWTEQRQDDAYPGQFPLRRDLGSTFSAPADDVLMFKLAYWFQR